MGRLFYMGEKFRTFDWIELFYTDSGQGEPLIMLHGFTGSSRLDWVETGVYDRMNKCGRRLIMLDARGHGESDKPHEPLSYSGRAMARDVNALARHLGLESYDLMGYSMGARVAVETALMFRGPRSLVLAGFQMRDTYWQWNKAERRAKARNMLADNPKSRCNARVAAERAGGDRKALAAWIEGVIVPEYSPADLARVKWPVLVVNGEDDPDAESVAGCFREGKPVVLETPHENILRDKTFPRHVLTFLKKVAVGNGEG